MADSNRASGSSSATDFSSKTVKQLKEYLSARGIQCAGYRKAELVGLAQQADRLGLERTDTADDHEESLDKRRRVQGPDNREQVLPRLSSVHNWTDDLLKIPPIETSDVVVYLLTVCDWSSERLKAHKLDRGYRLCTDNHVGNVKLADLDHGNFTYIKGTCIPETRQSAEPYCVWLLMRKDGRIESGGCNCVAGDGGTCKHVVALLYSVQQFCERHQDRHTEVGTDVTCKWDRARKTSRPMQISEIKMTSRVCPLPVPAVYNPCKPLSVEQAKTIQNEVFSLCLEGAPDAVILRSLTPPPGVTVNFQPPTVSELAISYQQTNGSATGFIDYMKQQLTEQNIHDISASDQGTDEWHLHRRGRITASVFHAICKMQKPWRASHSVIKKILGHADTDIRSPAVLYGRSKEPIVREIYQQNHEKAHEHFKIEQSGLVVDLGEPHLGASPDGIVSCTCCGTRTLEIKCSYKYKDMSPSVIAETGDYHIKLSNDGEVVLDQKSPWYYQIQGQMGVLKIECCDFVFYTEKGLHCERIDFNEALWKEIKETCRQVYETCIITELLKLPEK